MIPIYDSLINKLFDAFCAPHRQSQPETPKNYGMDYEEITIQTPDNLTLHGWFVKSTGNKVAFFSHPATFTKWGWNINDLGPGLTNKSYGKNVTFLPFIKHLVQAGYNVIMYDQRNHGKSEGSPLKKHDVIIDGYNDIIGVINFTMNHPTLHSMPKALVLFCQSSLAAMIAMTKHPEAFEDANIKAFVANQPTDIEDFYRRFGVPKFMLDSIKKTYIKHGLRSMEENNPVHWTKGILYPTLMVHNTADPWSTLSMVRNSYDSITVEKEDFFIAMEPHRFAAYNYFNNKPEKVLTFLSKYV